jgi:hypothetical protein
MQSLFLFGNVYKNFSAGGFCLSRGLKQKQRQASGKKKALQ